MNKKEVKEQQKMLNAQLIDNANSAYHEAVGYVGKAFFSSVLCGVTTLKVRGWNNSMIAQLGEPNQWGKNPHYSSGPLRALYLVSKAAEMEATMFDKLKRNLEKRESRQVKLSANPLKEKSLTAKQQEKLNKYQSEQLCFQFQSTMPSKLKTLKQQLIPVNPGRLLIMF
jgi:hypothetical protein